MEIWRKKKNKKKIGEGGEGSSKFKDGKAAERNESAENGAGKKKRKRKKK